MIENIDEEDMNTNIDNQNIIQNQGNQESNNQPNDNVNNIGVGEEVHEYGEPRGDSNQLNNKDSKLNIYDNDDAYMLGDGEIEGQDLMNNPEDYQPNEELINNEEYHYDNNNMQYQEQEDHLLRNEHQQGVEQLGENYEYMEENNPENENQYMLSGKTDEELVEIDNNMHHIQDNENNMDHNDMNMNMEGGEVNMNMVQNLEGQDAQLENPELNQENQALADDEDNKSQYNNLMKLQYISVCQSCKEGFNSSVNVPFMLSCGHFFCRNCLLTVFSDEEGRIYCPEDQNVCANGLGELKLLNNLISTPTPDNNPDQNEDKLRQAASFCQKHPDQRISHIIEQTKETLCVHCAFQTFRNNPQIEIKEITEVCSEVMEDVNEILENNQHYVEILQTTLKDIKDNKSQEEEKVVGLFDGLIRFMEQKKEEYIDQINNVFSINADKLSEMLDLFSQKMEEADEFKLALSQMINNPDIAFQVVELIYHYENYIKSSEETGKNNLELIEYKFSNDSETKLSKYLSGIAELKQKQKLVKFIPKNAVEKPQEFVSSNFNYGNNNFSNQNNKGQGSGLNSGINNEKNTINSGNNINNLGNSNNYSINNKQNVKNSANNNNSNKNRAESSNKNNDNEYLSMINKNNNIPVSFGKPSEKEKEENLIVSSNNKPGNTNQKVVDGKIISESRLSTNNNKPNKELPKGSGPKDSKLNNNANQGKTILFDPSSAIKSNYDMIKANNSLNKEGSTNNDPSSHIASVTSKNDYNQNKYSQPGNNKSSYSQEVLNTEELLKEHKETKNRNFMNSNKYSGPGNMSSLNQMSSLANNYLKDSETNNVNLYTNTEASKKYGLGGSNNLGSNYYSSSNTYLDNYGSSYGNKYGMGSLNNKNNPGSSYGNYPPEEGYGPYTSSSKSGKNNLGSSSNNNVPGKIYSVNRGTSNYDDLLGSNYPQSYTMNNRDINTAYYMSNQGGSSIDRKKKF